VDRIKILDEALWPKVPPDVVAEAERAAEADTVWIAQQVTATLSLWMGQATLKSQPAISSLLPK